MKLKRRKKNKYLVFLVFLLFCISIGYASFSSSLNITGTANANGEFRIEFINSKIIDYKGINILSSNVKISEDKASLLVIIDDMQYPGSGATVSCIIKNNGTVPAKLTNISFSGNDDEDISITLPESFKVGQKLGVNESYTLKFIVKWNIDSTITTKKTINFNVGLDYVQDVEEYSYSI